MARVVRGFIYVGRVAEKWIATVIDENEMVLSLSFPRDSEREAVREAKDFVLAKVSYGFRSEMTPFIRRVGRELIEFISLYLKGESPKSEFSLNAEGLTEFMRKVLSVVSVIPRGLVTCYGSIAEVISNPKAYRAVGNAVARNPWPILVPCHRVIRSDLSLGGYRVGIEFKKRLLKAEGVAITLTGRVLPSHFLGVDKLRELTKKAAEGIFGGKRKA